MSFAKKDRADQLEQLAQTEYDLLIVGGGITGAGIALQAAAAGLKTALVEMQDFAEGTSSRSTKLVHGGIRYLKTFDVEVVADTVSERKQIQQVAPHIPKPSRMLMPLYADDNATFTPFSVKVAMALYDRLAGVPEDSPFAHRYLERDEAMAYLPDLDATGLEGLAIYLDYQNNDARLTIENIKQAVDDGANALNQVMAVEMTEQADGSMVTTVQDQLTQQAIDVHSRIVVNAAGPWSDKIRHLLVPDDVDHIRPTKGVHLVVGHAILPVPETVYFDSGLGDGRMIFVIPREETTYFGTTDTDFTGDYRQPTVTGEDVDYLLKAVNGHFPAANVTLQDIQASWAGLRPLLGAGDYNGNQTRPVVDDETLHGLDATLQAYFENEVDRSAVDAALQDLDQSSQAASSVSRGFKITTDGGMINVAGGKLTDYRLMGAETMQVVQQRLQDSFDQTIKLVDSAQVPVSGGHFDPQDVDGAMQRYTQQLLEAGLPEADAADLAHLYGSNTPSLVDYVETGRVAPGLNLAQTASLTYALEHEAVLRPIDYLLRRTNYVLFRAKATDQIEAAVIDEMAVQLDWSADETQAMRDEYNTTRQALRLDHLKAKEG